MNRLLMACAVAIAFATGSFVAPKNASAGGPAAPIGSADFEIHQFYDALSPYGDWVADERFGHVWYPNAVAPDWRPYAVGRWIYTEAHGWYWDSPEPFAWAVYHYGRWGYDAEYGWYWVPGDTWSPAWVRWRYSDEYVGWAPEAPVAPVSFGGYRDDWAYGDFDTYGAGAQSYLSLGLSFGSYKAYEDYSYWPQRRYAPRRYAPVAERWTFVRPRHLVAPAVRTYAVPRANVSVVFNATKTVYRPRYRHGRVYNAGMPRAHWSRVTRQRVKVHRVHRTVHRGSYKGTRSKAHRRGSRDFHVYAPKVKKNAAPRRAPKKVAHKPPRRNKSVVYARGPRYQNARTNAARSGRSDPRKALAGPRRPQPRAAALGALGPTPRAARPHLRYNDVSGRPAIRNPYAERRASANARGKKPSAQRPPVKKAQAKKPSGKKPNAKRPPVKKAQAKKPQGPRPEAKRPSGKNPSGKKPSAKRPPVKKAQAKKPQGPRPQAKTHAVRKVDGRKAQANRPQARQPQARQPQARKAQAKRPPGKQPQGKRTQGKKTKGKKRKA